MKSVNILAEQETSHVKDSELYPLLQEYAETLALAEQVNERLLSHSQNLLEENKRLAAAKEELLLLSAKELNKKDTKLQLIQQELRHIKNMAVRPFLFNALTIFLSGYGIKWLSGTQPPINALYLIAAIIGLQGIILVGFRTFSDRRIEKIITDDGDEEDGNYRNT